MITPAKSPTVISPEEITALLRAITSGRPKENITIHSRWDNNSFRLTEARFADAKLSSKLELIPDYPSGFSASLWLDKDGLMFDIRKDPSGNFHFDAVDTKVPNPRYQQRVLSLGKYGIKPAVEMHTQPFIYARRPMTHTEVERLQQQLSTTKLTMQCLAGLKMPKGLESKFDAVKGRLLELYDSRSRATATARSLATEPKST